MGQQCSARVQQVQEVIQHELYEPSADQLKHQIELMRTKNQSLANLAEKYVSQENNQQFYGAKINGQKQGYGELKTRQDKRYYGYFKDNLPHAKGVLIFSNDHYYIGQFQNGKMHGKGKQISPYFTFEGEYENDFKKYGQLQTQQFTYEGSFQESKFGGYGQLSYQNGQKYAGDFKNGQFHGFGVYYGSQHNLIYQGQFKCNVYHGQGKYYWDDGTYYEGQYFQGVKQGHGKYVREESTISGVWDNGLITSRSKTKSSKSTVDSVRTNRQHYFQKMQQIY